MINRKNLKPYNTFGMEVYAESFSTFSDVNSLKQLLSEIGKSQKVLVLGGGSNLLFTKDFDGLVLKNEIKGIEKLSETENEVIIKAGAGENWHEFVLFTLENHFYGLENLSLIPGNVGASPMQNIGAYGIEIKDVFHSLDALHIDSGEIHTFDRESCEFGYRESIFKTHKKGQYVILNVSFRLSKKENLKTAYGIISDKLKEMNILNPGAKDVSNAVIEIRQSKLPDPKEIGNAGSFFKNPVITKDQFLLLQNMSPEIPNYPVDEQNVKVPAGWLIETAGWKGKTFGNFGVHKKQALVLVNYGGASGTDILNLSEEIIRDIHSRFGITLEREVNIL